MPELPDLSEYTNASLRELLERPSHYTAEAVHAAAKELAARSAVPRYYTLARTRVGEGPVRVVRKLRMDPGTKIRILFSESKLRAYCAALAAAYTILFVIDVDAVVRVLRSASPYSHVAPRYYLSTGFSLLVQLLFCLFLWALSVNLVSRKTD